MRWTLAALCLGGCVCFRVDTTAPPFPQEAHLTVRRSTGPDVEPFGRCGGFASALGPDFCASWTGGIHDGEGGASASYPPQLSSYGFVLGFDAERGQLCREFGDEFGDEHGCIRRDVICASSGEIVITGGGASVVADFPDGGHVEAAWRFPSSASDAGP